MLKIDLDALHTFVQRILPLQVAVTGFVWKKVLKAFFCNWSSAASVGGVLHVGCFVIVADSLIPDFENGCQVNFIGRSVACMGTEDTHLPC